MRPIVIEGHKGAGKTPLIAAMRKSLEAGKIKHHVAEPWQAAIKEFGIDPYYLFIDNDRARDIVEFLSGYVRHTVAQTDDDTLLIFDRQWLTFLTSVTLIDTEGAGFSQAQYAQYFRKFMKCDPWTVFIASTPYVLKNRASRKGPPPWNEDVDYWTRLRIYSKYRELFGGIHWVRKSRVDLEALGNKILLDYYSTAGNRND